MAIQGMIGLLNRKLQVMIAIRSDPPLAQGQTAPQIFLDKDKSASGWIYAAKDYKSS